MNVACQLIEVHTILTLPIHFEPVQFKKGAFWEPESFKLPHQSMYIFEQTINIFIPPCIYDVLHLYYIHHNMLDRN
jgi:hypothetical protein